ncbi:hypothetical protein ACWEWX_39460 [Streptomyces asiaticus]
MPEPVDILIGHSFGANAVLEHLADGGGAAQPRAAVLLALFFRPDTLRVDWPISCAPSRRRWPPPRARTPV